MLRINHPDGTAETFTYNTLGQVLSHTDGRGQTTRLQRTSRGLPSRRQDAKGEWIRKALRLAALVNENSAVYRFAYDAADRLSEEVRVDNLTRRFSYDAGGHLLRLDEIGYGETGERPERSTLPTPSSMRPTSPSTCGGTPWPRSSATRTARARVRTTAMTNASTWWR